MNTQRRRIGNAERRACKAATPGVGKARVLVKGVQAVLL